ncbi:hypothetical protein AB0D56_36220 [Streptomyces sp. NPDC048209]|uniref:hypothetical protein n=1 Tax=Streptomyces sp. NPDC048209 TaxID=3156689 RepID=UPI0034148732
MSTIPEPYQQHPVVHPAAVWTSQQDAPLVPYERPRIVYVPDAYGQMVPMLHHQAPAPTQRTPPRDLTPQPLIDPRAQVLAAGGVFAAGAGWGIGQALSALAGIGTGALMWLAIAIVAAKMAPAVGRTTTVTNTTVTNTSRWFGKSSSSH